MKSHVLAAKAIRKDLKKVFPATKFSVRSQSCLINNAVWIRWEAGPEPEKIYEIVDKYEKNSRSDLPQVTLVHAQRS